MKYDIFTDAESIVSHRLSEMPGDEVETLKQAGYNHVWTAFVEDFFEEGWDAARRAEVLEKSASVTDEFSEGEFEALEAIQDVFEDEYARGWFSSLKMAHDYVKSGGHVEQFCKQAMDASFDGPEKEIEGFLAGCEDMLESDCDLIKMAWKGPNLEETTPMNSFEFGKIAAYNDLVELAEEGASLQDCFELVGETLNTDLEKNASGEDVAFRAGIENVCYAFMKSASDVFDGSYDLESAADLDVLEHVLVDIRPEDEEGYEKTASYGDVVDFLCEFDGDTLEKIAQVIIYNMDDEGLDKIANISSSHKGGRNTGAEGLADSLGSDRLKQKLHENAQKKKFKYGKNRGAKVQNDMMNNAKRQRQWGSMKKNLRKAAPYAAGAAGLAALGGGAYALGKRQQREEEKSASLDDYRVNEAIAVLQEHGLLDD